MKPSSRLPRLKTLGALLLALPFGSSLAAATIYINRPLSESMTPNGFYWDFDHWDESGRVIDQSGNQIHGTLTASADTVPIPPTIVAGRFGQGVKLTPGATPHTARDPSIYSDYSSQSPVQRALDLNATSFTGGLWLNLSALTAPATTQEVHLIERGISASADNFISFKMVRWANQPSNWTLRLSLGNGVNSAILLSSTAIAALPIGEWNHLGFTFEYGEVSSSVTFWVNGVQLGTPVSTPYALNAIVDSEDRRLRVGERNVSSFVSVLDGTVDEAFLSAGAHQFSPLAIPEPASTALLLPAGMAWLWWRRRQSASPL